MKKSITKTITSNLFEGSNSRKGVAPIQVSLVLALLFCMLMPQKGWAEIVTTTYDFTGQQDAPVAVGAADATYTNCEYFTQIGNVDDPGRFAAQGASAWLLRSYGFLNGNTGGRRFLISKLYAGDIVTIESGGDQLSLDAACTIATKDENSNTYTMTAKGSLVVSVGKTTTSAIRTITIKHDNSASWNVEPSIEIYNLNNGSGSLSIYDKATPDFQLNGTDAGYLYSSNYALNNRIAVNSTDGWSWDNGLKNNTEWDIKNLAISNLEEGDRVVITYQEGSNQLGWTGLYFGSTTGQGSTLLNSEAFKDINNNGELNEDEGEAAIKRDDKVESQAVYTMTHDGHLDLIVFPGAIITKIEIYADHRALIETAENYKTNQGGYTMYFDGTGQIKEKSYMVPGGLKVQFGNDNEREVAHVVSTVEGPVAYINDYDGFKMARNGANNIESRVPTTGTYYRFTPDVDGIIHFTYKALSVRYNPYEYWNHGVYWNPGDYTVPDCEEDASSGQPCPYALLEYTKTGQGENDYTYTIKWQQGDFANKSGGNNTEALVTVNNDLEVKAGKIYYLYGNWNGDFGQGAYCGVARLMDVTFIPSKFVEPLAKCIDNALTEDSELATVRGYSTSDISEKAKSSNITGYTAEITSDNKLKISNITYADGADKAGVILLKLGTGDKDPVFVLTIAYDAAYCSSNWNQDAKGYTEGHTWDFSSDPLSIGSYWTNFFDTDNNINSGTHTTNTSSQLYDEIENRYDPDGAKAPEWNFKYLSSTSGGNLDPTFINVYDMVGDNADMIWETEGLWFNTESNQSCLFNEKQGSIDRSNKNQHDPQRYVGIIKGGEFTIPWLDKDDRVLIYMGNSTTSSAGPLAFDITNALDALGNEITSEYRIGGSTFNTWQADGSNHSDPNYQGCYHFIAKADGDMTFKMVGGTICKIYKIVIYRGNHMRTNDVERANNGPLVLVNEEGATEGKGAGFSIHYRGKGEIIANPEVIVKTGNLTDDSFTSEYLSLWSSNNGVSFTSRVGDFGNFRLRLKDMDNSGNYVCDFADRNITVGYKQTVDSYPYTWDFTDIPLTGGKGSGEDVAAENTNYPETTNVNESKGWDLSMWDENGYMILCNPDPTLATDDNYIFYHDSDKGIENHLKGNQLFANDKIIPETKGLWFYMDNNDRAYNGSMQITSDGLRLANTKRTVNGSNTMGWWNYKMVVPEVPAGAAIYLRMARDTSVGDDDYSQKQGEDPVYFLNTAFNFGTDAKTYLSTSTQVKNGTDYSFYEIENNGQGTGEWILAIKNTKSEASNLTFTLNGWILKKLAISEDAKTVNKLGYASESRTKEIDPELMGYMTGTGLTAYTVDKVTYGDNEGDIPSIKLKAVPTTNVIGKAKHHDHNAYIIYNRDEAVNGTKAVSALNNGFHLFVPDMHDRTDGTDKLKPALDVSGNGLRAWLPEDPATEVMCQTYTYTESNGSITAVGGSEGKKEYTTYALSSKGKNTVTGKTEENVERFRRVAAKVVVDEIAGVIAGNNKAYLPLLTTEVKPNDNVSGSKGMFAIVFVDEEEGTETTSLDGVESIERTYDDGSYYTLGGVKVQNPTKKGIYIKNGKKVVIK